MTLTVLNSGAVRALSSNCNKTKTRTAGSEAATVDVCLVLHECSEVKGDQYECKEKKLSGDLNEQGGSVHGRDKQSRNGFRYVSEMMLV